MPITIEHGPSAGMMALAGAMGGIGASREAQLARSAQITQAAMGIGARRDMQVQQLEAQRNMQMQQIEAQADRQKEAADTAYARTALAAGLQEKIQERQFDNQMEKMQEAARLQAEQWDYQYTTKQRQEIARLNEADALVESDPQYADIRDQWKAISLQRRAGITPRPIPADPNKPQYPEGVGPGILTKEPDGSTTTIDQYGQKKLIQRYDQSPEYLEKKMESELQQAQQQRLIKLQDLHRKYEMELDEVKVPLMQEATEGGWLGIGAQEAGEVGERLLMDAEKRERLRHHFPELYAEQQTEQPAAEVREQPQQQVEDPNWAARYEAGGVKVTEADRKLPSKVGKAQAYIRHMIPGQYKGIEEMPPEIREAFMEASRLLQSYYQAVAEQRE